MGSVAVASRLFSKNKFLREEILKKYPDAKFNDEGLLLYGEALISFLYGYEKAITALETIDKEILRGLPDLKVIGKYGVGLDMLDLRAMNDYGVKLGWKGGINKRSVSEQVVSCAISLLHKSYFANNEVKKGKWNQIKGSQLTGKTVGIIGCGHIGKDLIGLMKPFGCKILAHDILDFPEFYSENKVTSLGLDDLLSASDIITLHLPLNDSTYRIINDQRMSLMRKNAILINYARGGLIDEEALTRRLLEGQIAGVALDVFEAEPPSANSLIHMENVYVTPHIGASTSEAIKAMGISAIKGLDTAENPLNFLSYI